MRITNRTRRSVIGWRIQLADSWFRRFRGFLGRPRPVPGEGILLLPCNAIHTMGMTFDLDVLFLDGEGRVLHLIRSIPPWRFTRRVQGGRYVLEVPPGTIEASGTEVGDELTWHEPSNQLHFWSSSEKGGFPFHLRTEERDWHDQSRS